MPVGINTQSNATNDRAPGFTIEGFGQNAARNKLTGRKVRNFWHRASQISARLVKNRSRLLNFRALSPAIQLISRPNRQPTASAVCDVGNFKLRMMPLYKPSGHKIAQLIENINISDLNES
jgi:hypothetical protein